MPPPPDQGEIQLPFLPPVEELPPIIEDLPPPIVERPVIPELPPIVETPPLPPVEEVKVPVVGQPLFPPEDDIITLPPYERGEIPVPMIKEPGKRPVIEVRLKDPETGEFKEVEIVRPAGVSGPSVIPIEPIEIPTEVPGIEVPEIPPLELPAMPPVEQAPPAFIGDELLPIDESEFAVYGDLMKDWDGPGLTNGPDLYGRPVLTGGVGGDIAKGYEGPGIEEIPGVFAESDGGAYLPETPVRATRAQVPAYTAPEPEVFYGLGEQFVGPVEETILPGFEAPPPGFTEPLPSQAIAFPVRPQGEVIESRLPSIADQELAAAGLPGLLESPVVQELATSGLLDIPIESLPPEVVQAILNDVMMYGEA